MAERRLPGGVFDYIDGAADDERSMANNADAFARLEFRPSDGAQIEELTEGRHTATVIYWPIDEGRESARSYTWSFDVI